MDMPTGNKSTVNFDFHGRTALVTGAGRGVGEEIARLFHASGARVAVSDIDGQAARQLADRLDDSGVSAMALTLDVRSKRAFEDARDRIASAWGRTDIVVNNAGYAKRTPVQDITTEEFDDIVAINMRSVFLSCQVFADHMRSNGWGPHRQHHFAGRAERRHGRVGALRGSQGGATMLSKYFAQQLAGTGVTVNAIAPGPISTAKGRLSQEQIERIEKLVPIGRFGEASEFAAAVALLASDQGGFFVGATLDMNGGLFMR
jgi:3-oxoacyl-[acyl-carrier protein] reductase